MLELPLPSAMPVRGRLARLTCPGRVRQGLGIPHTQAENLFIYYRYFWGR